MRNIFHLQTAKKGRRAANIPTDSELDGKDNSLNEQTPEDAAVGTISGQVESPMNEPLTVLYHSSHY